MSETVLVTGANRGIGLEFCRQYLEAGYSVIAVPRSKELSGELAGLDQKYGAQLRVIPADITDTEQLEKLRTALNNSSINMLINNAGIYGERLPFGEVTAEEWMKVLQVNTIAPLMVMQALSDLMADNARIMLLSSKMGSMTDNTSGGSYIYRSSKAALNAVGKSLAHDLTGRGIAVAICHPGWVRTSMGGPNALIDAPTSVRGLRLVLQNLTLGNSGLFFNYDGTIIPW